MNVQEYKVIGVLEFDIEYVVIKVCIGFLVDDLEDIGMFFWVGVVLVMMVLGFVMMVVDVLDGIFEFFFVQVVKCKFV